MLPALVTKTHAASSAAAPSNTEKKAVVPTGGKFRDYFAQLEQSDQRLRVDTLVVDNGDEDDEESWVAHVPEKVLPEFRDPVTTKRRRRSRNREKAVEEADLAVAHYAARFSSDDEARLRTILDEDALESSNVDRLVGATVLADCRNNSPQSIIRHLSASLRREPRLAKAPVAWYLVHRQLSDAFMAQSTTAGDDHSKLNNRHSAIFHLQQAARGLEVACKLRSSRMSPIDLHDELSRVEIDIGRCFAHVADMLPDNRRGDRRRRDAIQRQLEAAAVALIHVKAKSTHFYAAHELRAEALLRQMALDKHDCIQWKELLEKALASLIEASLGDDSVKPPLLGRLAECHMAVALTTTDRSRRLDSLQQAHKATLRLQSELVEDSRELAAAQIAATHMLALQLELKDTHLSSCSAAVLNSVEVALTVTSHHATDFVEERIGLRCLEARIWMLENSLGNALVSLEEADKEMGAGHSQEETSEAARRRWMPLRREILRAIASVALKQLTHESVVGDHLAKEQLKVRARTALESIDRDIHGTPESRRQNPDAVCICALEFAREKLKSGAFDEAQAAVYRALSSAFEVMRRVLHEPEDDGPSALCACTTLDPARTVISKIVDVGVDVVTSRIRRDFSEHLLTCGAWFWMPTGDTTTECTQDTSRPPPAHVPYSSGDSRCLPTVPNDSPAFPAAAYDLLRLAEALAALAEIQSLYPILIQRIERGHLPPPLMKAARKAEASCRQMHDAARLAPCFSRSKPLAPQPVPVVPQPSVPAKHGTLVDLLNEVPIILRASTIRIKSDPDREEATAVAERFATLLEGESADFLLSCIGRALRVPTNSDIANAAASRNESIVAWAVCGQHPQTSLIGIALCCSSDGAPRAGVFYTSWTQRQSKDFQSHVSTLRSERGQPSHAAAAELSRTLKVGPLIKSLPSFVDHMIVILPPALANAPIHALPIEAAADDPMRVCDRLSVRYATSLAAIAANNHRSRNRQKLGLDDSSISLPLLAFTKRVDSNGRCRDSLLEGTISAIWQGPQAEVAASNQFFSAVSSRPPDDRQSATDADVERIRKDLRHAHSVQLCCVSHGLDSAGGLPAIIISSVGAIPASKVAMAHYLFERARMVVIAHGTLPSSGDTKLITMPSALLCAGSSAVVASLWDGLPGSAQSNLIRTTLTFLMWREYCTNPSANRQVASALRAALNWVRRATIKDVRDLFEKLPLNEAKRREVRSALLDAFGPQAGNSNDQAAFAPDIADWAGLACFGDGNECACVNVAAEKSYRRTFNRNLVHVATKACGRLSKEIAPRASVVAKALALTSNDVSSEDKTHISYTGAAKRGASGGTGTLEDAGENMASDHNADNENEVDEDPLLKHDTIANEIVHEWVAYVETIEGRQLVNELGPENALRVWRRVNRKRHTTRAVRIEVDKWRAGAVTLARKGREQASVAREKFRQAGGDDAVLRFKHEALSKAHFILNNVQKRAQIIVEGIHTRSIPAKKRIADSAAFKQSTHLVNKCRTQALALFRQGKQTAVEAREAIHVTGINDVLQRVSRKMAESTRARCKLGAVVAKSAVDNVGSFHRSRIIAGKATKRMAYQ